jgi:endonuclease YncB( thermonuclease family)
MMMAQRLLWFAVLLLTTMAHADPLASEDIYVVDGDAIAVRGQRIRVIGFEALELGGHAHCGIERMLAARATSRLRQIIRTIAAARAGTSRWTGTMLAIR